MHEGSRTTGVSFVLAVTTALRNWLAFPNSSPGDGRGLALPVNRQTVPAVEQAAVDGTVTVQ